MTGIDYSKWSKRNRSTDDELPVVAADADHPSTFVEVERRMLPALMDILKLEGEIPLNEISPVLAKMQNLLNPNEPVLFRELSALTGKPASLLHALFLERRGHRPINPAHFHLTPSNPLKHKLRIVELQRHGQSVTVFGLSPDYAPAIARALTVSRAFVLPADYDWLELNSTPP